MDWDDDDEGFFDTVDQLVEQHKQGKTQRTSQPSSPPYLPQPAPSRHPPAAQNGPLQQSNSTGNRPGGAGPPLPPQQNKQPPPPQQQQPYQALPRASAAGAPLAGHVSQAAAELRRQQHPQQQQQQQAAAGQPGASLTPAQLQALVAQLQSERDALQRQMGTLSGTNQVLRDRLERSEGERNGLRQRLQAEPQRRLGGGASAAKPPASGGPHLAAHTAAEVQRQLDSLRQELAFKAQEVDEAQRRAAEVADRARQAEATAAELQARLDAEKGAQQRQDGGGEAGAAEASHRSRPGGSRTPRAPALEPAQQQQQQSSVQRLPGTPTAPPQGGGLPSEDRGRPGIFSSLRHDGAGSGGSSDLVARVWASQGESIAALIGALSKQQQPPAQHVLSRLPAGPPAAAVPAPGHGAPPEAGLLQRLQQVARQEIPPADLLSDVLSTVAAALERRGAPGAAAAPGQQRAPPAAPDAQACALDTVGPALELAAQLVREDDGCRAAAVASCSGRAPAGAGRPPTSSRIRFSSQPVGQVGQRPAPEAPFHLQQALQRMGTRPDLYCGLGSGMLALALRASLALGPQHAAELSGGLAAVAAIAEGMPPGAGPGRESLEPVFTSGAMALFLRPVPLRPAALRLLQLMLGDGRLLAVLQAGIACDEGDAFTGDAGASGRQAQPGAAAFDDAMHGSMMEAESSALPPKPADAAEPMQVDGGPPGAAADAAGPWSGARGIFHALLDSLTLDGEGAGGAGAAAAHPAPDGGLPASPSSLAAARAAMQAVAALREQGAHGVLLPLLAPQGGRDAARGLLPQRLLALAEAAVSQGGEDAPVALLVPCAPPTDPEAARAWQQRLRVAQEALTLLRGLVAGQATGVAAIDELTSTSAATRLSLVALGKLSRLQAPQGPPASPPLPLATWAVAIGSSSAAASVAGAPQPAWRGELACCTAEDVAYMARSMRQRVLHRLRQDH